MSTTRVPVAKRKAPHARPGSTRGDFGHLLRRAGFGATLPQVEAAYTQGLNTTVDQLINYGSVADNFTPPDPSVLGDAKQYSIEPLTVWWLKRMLMSNHSLQEKMTLFWHGHFATAYYKVRSTQLMYQQNQLFRDRAVGRFDDLLTGVYKDPAMLIWLDGQRNIKAAPNENFAREVMELFALGIGNYTESDVHANARAFTGWRLDQNQQAIFVSRLHDDGMKTLLGQTGNWNADDAVRILAAHPATGPFLAGTLWQFFGSDAPSVGVVQQMAAAYYVSGHQIGEMLRVMFLAPEFYADSTRTNHVKSPTDFAVTTLRQLGLTDVDISYVPRVLSILGQELFNPPNVGGWPGGSAWLNGGTMLTRFNFASRITGDAPGSKSIFDANAIVDSSNVQDTGQLVYYLADVLGVTMSQDTLSALMRYAGRGSVDSPTIDFATKARGLIHLLMVSPEYQIA